MTLKRLISMMCTESQKRTLRINSLDGEERKKKLSAPVPDEDEREALAKKRL